MKPKLHVVDASAEPAKAPRDWRKVARYSIGSVLMVGAAAAVYWYFWMPHPATAAPYPMYALLALAFVALKLGPRLIGERVHVHHHHHPRED